MAYVQYMFKQPHATALGLTISGDLGYPYLHYLISLLLTCVYIVSNMSRMLANTMWSVFENKLKFLNLIFLAAKTPDAKG